MCQICVKICFQLFAIPSNIKILKCQIVSTQKIKNVFSPTFSRIQFSKMHPHHFSLCLKTIQIIANKNHQNPNTQFQKLIFRVEILFVFDTFFRCVNTFSQKFWDEMLDDDMHMLKHHDVFLQT